MFMIGLTRLVKGSQDEGVLYGKGCEMGFCSSVFSDSMFFLVGMKQVSYAEQLARRMFSVCLLAEQFG